MGLVHAGFDLREIEAIGRRRGCGFARGECGRSEQSRGSGNTERAAHDLARAITRDDDVADGLAVGRAAGNVVMGLKSRGPVAELVYFSHMQGQS